MLLTNFDLVPDKAFSPNVKLSDRNENKQCIAQTADTDGWG